MIRMKTYCRACFLFCSRDNNPLKLWAKWVIIAIVYLVSLVGGNVGTALIFSDDSKVCYETVWFGSCYWDAFPLTFLFLTPLYLMIATFIVAWRNSRKMWKESMGEAKGLHRLMNEDVYVNISEDSYSSTSITSSVDSLDTNDNFGNLT